MAPQRWGKSRDPSFFGNTVTTCNFPFAFNDLQRYPQKWGYGNMVTEIPKFNYKCNIYNALRRVRSRWCLVAQCAVHPVGCAAMDTESLVDHVTRTAAQRMLRSELGNARKARARLHAASDSELLAVLRATGGRPRERGPVESQTVAGPSSSSESDPDPWT